MQKEYNRVDDLINKIYAELHCLKYPIRLFRGILWSQDNRWDY